ncbi:hypothetical protein CR513_04613, partial [Mucuna pruriens]
MDPKRKSWEKSSSLYALDQSHSTSPFSTPMLAEYIEGDNEVLETSFQSLKIASTTSAEIEKRGPKSSRVEIMADRVLIKGGYQPGKGLCHKLEGIAEPVMVQENLGMEGLSYQGTSTEGRPNWKTLESQKQNANQSNKPIEGEDVEVEALVEMERWIKQEGLKFQSLAEDLEGINLGDETEKKEV